jgi:erythromycin esterase-like protein
VHNGHLGDARFTSMGTIRKELNLGQLCREQLGRDIVNLLGCGTHTGTVAAAHEWGSDMVVMKDNPSRPGGWEYLARQTGIPSLLLDLRAKHMDAHLRADVMAEPRLERFIGVIHPPETERASHYSAAILPEQFDGYVWLEKTEAVKPWEKRQPMTADGAEGTYPFGL